MAINFMNMPAPQYPRSALLDFAPLGQAIDTYRQGAQQKAVMDQNRAIGQTAATQGATAAANQAYGLGRLEDGAALNKQGEGQQDRLTKRYGSLAQRIDQEQDPNQRSRMWTGFLGRLKRESTAMGINGEFDPDEMDPMTGPKLFMAQAGIVNDPLDREYRQAQINKMNRDAAESGTTYGKSGSIFQGPDGKFYSIQFGGDGSRVILPLQVPGQGGQPSVSGPSQPQAPIPQEGAGRFAAPGMSTAQTPPMPLTPSRGVDVVGNQMYDKATGAPIRDVGGNLAEAERQKALGEGQAKGQLGLPKAKTALQDYEIKNRLVNDEIDRAISQAGPWTTGFVGNVASYVAGTPAHDLSKTLVGIQSNLGFDTLQQMRENSPTGGALGSVTERELELLQSTWGSLMQSQSEPQFRYHLNRLKEIKREYAVLKRQAYEADVARFGAGNVPNPDGASAGAAPSGDGWTDVGGVRIREKR